MKSIWFLCFPSGDVQVYNLLFGCSNHIFIIPMLFPSQNSTSLSPASFGYKKIIMSGQAEKGRNGVAVMCDRASANAMMGYDTVSDRILSVRFRGRKVNITIIQVYAPTSTASDEEQDNFFIKLQSTIDRTPKGDVTMEIS